jgi:Cd2+/Zn2+-exporting ATPase
MPRHLVVSFPEKEPDFIRGLAANCVLSLNLMSVRIMNSNHQAEKPRCCAGEHPQNHQAIEAKSATGMTFKIEGLDCAEEVATLKSAIGPLVGGSDKLAFDVLNGRMMLLSDAEPVSEKTIIKAVAATGMKAVPW